MHIPKVLSGPLFPPNLVFIQQKKNFFSELHTEILQLVRHLTRNYQNAGVLYQIAVSVKITFNT